MRLSLSCSLSSSLSLSLLSSCLCHCRCLCRCLCHHRCLCRSLCRYFRRCLRHRCIGRCLFRCLHRYLCLCLRRCLCRRLCCRRCLFAVFVAIFVVALKLSLSSSLSLSLCLSLFSSLSSSLSLYWSLSFPLSSSLSLSLSTALSVSSSLLSSLSFRCLCRYLCRYFLPCFCCYRFLCLYRCLCLCHCLYGNCRPCRCLFRCRCFRSYMKEYSGPPFNKENGNFSSDQLSSLSIFRFRVSRPTHWKRMRFSVVKDPREANEVPKRPRADPAITRAFHQSSVREYTKRAREREGDRARKLDVCSAWGWEIKWGRLLISLPIQPPSTNSAVIYLLQDTSALNPALWIFPRSLSHCTWPYPPSRPSHSSPTKLSSGSTATFFLSLKPFLFFYKYTYSTFKRFDCSIVICVNVTGYIFF